MALGSRNREQTDSKLLIVKLVTKGKNEAGQEVPIMPHKFRILEKNTAGEWVAREDLVDRLSGDLFKIEEDQGTWEGKAYDILKLYFSDGEAQESYLCDFRYNQDSRALINSLDNLTAFNKLEVSLYAKKSAKNGKTYSNIALWQDEELVKGKVGLKELPQPEVIKNKAGEVKSRDYTDVDAYYKKVVKDLIKRVEAYNKSVKKVAPKLKADAVPASTPEEEGVPF